MHAERGPERLLAGLAVHLQGVVTGLRPECRAAAVAMGHAQSARACATGALLPPRLGRRHRDLASGQARVRPPPPGGEIRPRGLVDERLVERLAEELLRQIGLALLAEQRRVDIS